MKLLRIGPQGRETPAILDPSGKVRDLTSVVEDIAGTVLTPEGLERVAAAEVEHLPVITPTRIGPCVGAVGKFICIGLNYSDHAEESGMPAPKEPVLFMKATSSICGPNDSVVIPKGATKTDWEVELGVVIGKPGVYIEQSDAFSHIAGYCVVNDVSERAFQLEREGQWVKGKSCDTFGPIGPWLVTSDEVSDPQDLRMWLEVDDERIQDGSTETMIFGVAELVAYVSRFMSLKPGDIISTGTPPGVGLGQKPPRYLRGGEVMRLSIEGLGVQEQRVRRHSDASLVAPI